MASRTVRWLAIGLAGAFVLGAGCLPNDLAGVFRGGLLVGALLPCDPPFISPVCEFGLL